MERRPCGRRNVDIGSLSRPELYNDFVKLSSPRRFFFVVNGATIPIRMLAVLRNDLSPPISVVESNKNCILTILVTLSLARVPDLRYIPP